MRIMIMYRSLLHSNQAKTQIKSNKMICIKKLKVINPVRSLKIAHKGNKKQENLSYLDKNQHCKEFKTKIKNLKLN